MEKRRTPTFSIRLPPDLRADLERFAAEETRPLANYIIAVLTEHIAAKKKATGKRK